MVILERIHSISVARIYAFFGILLGIIFGILAMFLGIMMKYSNPLLILLLFIVGLFAGMLCGVVYGLIGSWLYNLSASIVGGIKLDITKNKNKGGGSLLNSIDPISYGKVEGVSIAIIAIVIVALLLLLDATLKIGMSMTLIAGFGTLVIVLGAVVGFVGGWLNGYFYNFAMSKIGAIQLKLSENKKPFNNTLGYIDYMSYAKINAFLIAIWSVISLIIHVILILFLMIFVRSMATSIGGAMIIGLGIVGAVYGVVVGFVISIGLAILYNIFAKRIGGVQLKLT